MTKNLSEWILTRFFRGLTTVMCKIDDSQVERVPERGPWILVTNHVNVLELPVIYTRLRPRPISGFFAAYRLERAWSRWLLYTFGGIPVHRGEPDRHALRQAIEKIRGGAIFALAPEGTRSGDGQLGPGKAGVVLLAQKSGAPIQPLVHYGDVHWEEKIKRLRRVPFNIAVGRPFLIDTRGQRVTATIRRAITDEIMLQMASLLPESYHGIYVGREPTTEYLRFIDQP